MRFFRLVLSSFLISICAAHVAAAATISGHIVDPDGRTVPGAQIVVSSALGTVAEGQTDQSGAFHVDGLTAGTYEVRVVAAGFQADPVTVPLAASAAIDLNVALRVSAISESVVVSASQTDEPLSQAADTVTVVTAADLQARQTETVADALRLVPGLTVVRSGGRGNLTSLFPRGGNSSYTLVLVDGIRANDFGGSYDFAHLSVADVDRVEIVRGPESALFGADAIGAVVQVVTRRGGTPRASGLFEGGGQGTRRTTVEGSAGRGNWAWSGGAEHIKSDGFDGSSASGERVSNDDYRLSHVTGRIGYQAPGGVDFLVSGNVGRDERGFPGPFGSDPKGTYGGVDRVSRGIDDTRQIGGRFARSWSPRIRQRVDASYTDLAGSFTSQYGPSSSGTRRFDARVQEDIALSQSISASAGVEFVRERGSSTYVTGADSNPIPIRRAVTGVFGEIRYAKSERLFITAGTRVEHVTRDALGADAYGSRPQFPDQTVNSVNPKIAVSYLVAGTPAAAASTRLRASAGTGIRPPNAFEIAFTNNPGLKPERSRSFDAGIEQQFGHGAYVVAATGFVNRYDDLIVSVGKAFQNASQYQTDNISNARARGAELSGEARLGHGVSLQANYTFLSTAIMSIDGLARIAPTNFAVGDPLIRRPRHQGTLGLTYSAGRVTAFTTVLMRGKVLDIDPSFGASGGLFDAKGYTTADAGASLKVTRNFEAYLRVTNLADRAYEEVLGYPALRRQAMLGVRVAAGR